MLVALEINGADFLFMTATDAARRGTTKVIATAGFFADLDQAFFRLELRNVAEISERDVAQGRR